MTGRAHVGVEADGARVVDLTVLGIGRVAEALLRAPELHRLVPHLAEAPGGVVHAATEVAPLHVADAATRVCVAEFPPSSGEADRVRVATYETVAPLLLGPGDALAHPGEGMGLVAAPAIAAIVGHAGHTLADAEGEAAIAGYAAAVRWMRVGGPPPAPVCVGVSVGAVAVTPAALEERRHADGTYDVTLTLATGRGPLAAGRWRDLPAALGRLVALASRETPVLAGDLVVAVLPRAPRAPAQAVVAAGDHLTLTSDGLGGWTHDIVAPLPVAD